MIKGILISCALCFFGYLMAFGITKEEVIDNFAENYPKAQLIDLYKSFYQDNYGPGHLLADSVAAKRYFMSELRDSLEWGGPQFEYTGEGNNFVRVNMDLVRKGVIPAEVYFEAFEGSIGRVGRPEEEVWISEWMAIDSIIKRKGYHFINEAEDREYIEKKLASKDFPIHHSDRFNETYNFHYRIISLPEFTKLMDNYITKTDGDSVKMANSGIDDFKIPTQQGDSISMEQFKGRVIVETTGP